MKNPFITKEQINFWHQNGYLLLRNVLKDDQVAFLSENVDQVIETRNKKNISDTTEYHGEEYYNILQAIEYTSNLDFLLDYKPLFGIVLSLMGPYIQVMSCDIFVRKKTIKNVSGISKFHTDGGLPFQQILPNKKDVPLQFKVQYFLTDLLTEDGSNFVLIPGTHKNKIKHFDHCCLISECNQYLDRGEYPPNSLQIKVKKGDVLIHLWSLWHAVAPNTTDQIRKSICVRYGQMWLKPYYNSISKKIINRLNIRCRRLLGEYGKNSKIDAVYRAFDQLDIIYGNEYSDLRAMFEKKNGV